MTALHDLWAGLPAGLQDGLTVLALLLPGLAAGLIVLRGFAPGGLVRAMCAASPGPTPPSSR